MKKSGGQIWREGQRKMKEQAKAVGTDMIQDHINKVDLSKKPFKAIGDSGQEYTADSIIISTYIDGSTADI